MRFKLTDNPTVSYVYCGTYVPPIKRSGALGQHKTQRPKTAGVDKAKPYTAQRRPFSHKNETARPSSTPQGQLPSIAASTAPATLSKTHDVYTRGNKFHLPPKSGILPISKNADVTKEEPLNSMTEDTQEPDAFGSSDVDDGDDDVDDDVDDDDVDDDEQYHVNNVCSVAPHNHTCTAAALKAKRVPSPLASNKVYPTSPGQFIHS